MPEETWSRLAWSGREITPAEVAHIKEVVQLCSGLSRDQLAQTLCQHLNWVTASGSYKVQSCLRILEELQARGEVRLPKAQKRKSVTIPEPQISTKTDPQEAVTERLREMGPVELHVVTEAQETALWNEYVHRYHYLGYKKPFGFVLRYLITAASRPLGCVLLAGAAKSIAVRDEWIGWTRPQRMKNLPWVINNSRFVIFPWVSVKNLASHVLGQLVQRVGEDWQERWGYCPLLLETFVDPARYVGTIYRAAGWVRLGTTTGMGHYRRGQQKSTTPKVVYVRPLAGDFQQQLCSAGLVGRVIV